MTCVLILGIKTLFQQNSLLVCSLLIAVYKVNDKISLACPQSYILKMYYRRRKQILL